MAKKVKVAKKAAGKVAGCMLKGSSIANVYEALEDQKSHSLQSLKACLKNKSIDLLYRVRCLRKIGRARKQWDIEITEDRVRLIKGKPRATAPAAKPKSKAKPAHKAAKPSAKPTGRASVQDVPVDED